MSAVRVLQAITSVRVGEGTAIGAVDLPLAREPHTRWPFIPGSALKGSLRARAEAIGSPDIHAAFGPRATDDGPAARGDLHIGDAVLLALPVRALRGTFVLLTCPLALARMARGCGGAPATLPTPGPDEVVAAPALADALRMQAAKVEIPGREPLDIAILEDLDWYLRRDPGVEAWSTWLARWTGREAPVERLAVVADDVFAHAAAAWTEVRIRNRIGADGVVEGGALFSAELAPPETLWWWTVSGGHDALLPAAGETFTVGGWQTVGMGRVAWYGEGG